MGRKDSTLGDLSSQGHMTALKPQFLLGEAEVQESTEVGGRSGGGSECHGSQGCMDLDARENTEELRLQMMSE